MAFVAIVLVVAVVATRYIRIRIDTREAIERLEDADAVSRIVFQMIAEDADGVSRNDHNARFVSTLASLRSYARSVTTRPAGTVRNDMGRVRRLLVDNTGGCQGRSDPATQPSDVLLWFTESFKTYEGNTYAYVTCGGDVGYALQTPATGRSGRNSSGSRP